MEKDSPLTTKKKTLKALKGWLGEELITQAQYDERTEKLLDSLTDAPASKGGTSKARKSRPRSSSSDSEGA